MPKPFGLTFGALCDLGISGIITEADRDRARKRLMKQIPSTVQPFVEPSTYG